LKKQQVPSHTTFEGIATELHIAQLCTPRRLFPILIRKKKGVPVDALIAHCPKNLYGLSLVRDRYPASPVLPAEAG
jgi:hypothetical protein